MRKLTPAQLRDLAEYDRDMEAIKRAREQGKPPTLSKATHGSHLPASWRTRPPVTTTRPVLGFRNGAPWRVCHICHEPAHLAAGRLLCAGCQAEVSWRVSLARSGLRVVG